MMSQYYVGLTIGHRDTVHAHTWQHHGSAPFVSYCYLFDRKHGTVVAVSWLCAHGHAWTVCTLATIVMQFASMECMTR